MLNQIAQQPGSVFVFQVALAAPNLHEVYTYWALQILQTGPHAALVVMPGQTSHDKHGRHTTALLLNDHESMEFPILP